MLMTVFTTERLVVRQLRPDDLDDFAAICADPDVLRYMGDGKPLTREQTETWIGVSLTNYAERGWGCFAVTTRENDRLIGFCGFARPPERPGIVELIYAFTPEQWGKGYATEVAGAMLNFGFEQCGLTRIEATVDPPNLASKRVLAKIGMTYERTGRDGDVLVDYFAIEKNP
jgi:ribosomal-protein-alanine N-acetyltransferase